MKTDTIKINYKNAICYSLLLLLLLCKGTFVSADSGTLYVSVRKSMLRKNADFLSPSVTEVSYGDVLLSSGQEGLWHKVRSSSGKEGYLHQSAVTTRRVVLNADAAFMKSRSNDNTIVMAGKGFNKEIEKQYAEKNKGVNYKAVDRMEATRVSPAEISSFAKAGKLGGK